MDNSYTQDGHVFSVILEYVPARDFGAATIYCDYGIHFVFLGYGVNVKYPTYTYLVYRSFGGYSFYNYILSNLNVTNFTDQNSF